MLKRREKKPKEPKAPKPLKAPKAPRTKKTRQRKSIQLPFIGGKQTGLFRFRKEPTFVLFLGDEGGILLYIRDREVKSREYIPDTSPENLQVFTERFAEDKNAPIVMVVDTMDQNYVQQTLPPVTSLSVSKLIKRRLERDFPNDEIKGALALGRETGARKDWNFLMIALERTAQLNTWLDYLDTLPNWLSGIYLVPVETEILVRLLDKALQEGRTEQKPQWQFFISYNKVSGFRQVILRKGRLIFTRVGQPVGELTPEVIAGNIEQEALNTIEYMKRMGFYAQEGLDVYVVASEAINKVIDPARFKATSVYRLTPHEVSEKLGLSGATKAGDEYGDVVLAAVLGGARKHVLKFITESARKLDVMFKIKVGQRIAISIFTGALISYVGSTLYDIKSVIDSVDNLHTVRNQQQRALEALKTDIAKAPENIDKITDLVELNEILQEQAISPLPILRRLTNALNDEVRVKSISWEVVENRPTRQNPGTPPPAPGAKPENNGPTASVKLAVEFLTNTDEQQKFLRHANAWLEKLKEGVKADEINFTVLPGAVGENENFEIALGNASATAANRFDGSPIEAQLIFYAPVKDPPPPKPDEKEPAAAPAAAPPPAKPPGAP